MNREDSQPPQVLDYALPATPPPEVQEQAQSTGSRVLETVGDGVLDCLAQGGLELVFNGVGWIIDGL